MSLKKITAPQGSIVSNGKNKAELTWNPDFAAKRNAQFSRKQMFVDSEVFKTGAVPGFRCEPVCWRNPASWERM